MISWAMSAFGLTKGFAQLLIVGAVVSFAYGTYQAAASAIAGYEDRVGKVATLKADLARAEGQAAAVSQESARRLRAMLQADREREAAKVKADKAKEALRSRVNEVARLQRKIVELEALADKQVEQPEEFVGPTLDGGSRTVAQDFTPEPEIDVSSLEFDGALRLLHDDALRNCGNGASDFAFDAAGRPDQAALTVGEFVQAVVANYCVAAETKGQLDRAQRWAAQHCTVTVQPAQGGAGS